MLMVEKVSKCIRHFIASPCRSYYNGMPVASMLAKIKAAAAKRLKIDKAVRFKGAKEGHETAAAAYGVAFQGNSASMIGMHSY